VTAESAALVLDEHATGALHGLRARGMDAFSVAEFHATSVADPDVVRAIGARLADPWVLVTCDLTLVDDHQGFDWDRYAIAWVMVPAHIKGAAYEYAKVDAIHHHARRMVEQVAGDHFTYDPRAQYKTPPSMVSRRRRDSRKVG
jgi:hypothetical protein